MTIYLGAETSRRKKCFSTKMSAQLNVFLSTKSSWHQTVLARKRLGDETSAHTCLRPE